MSVPSGLLLVDKPQGMTSHDVVARARRALGTRKIGHAGTLDPMATGLLVLGVGSSTRLLHHLVGADKRYLATIRLGESTTTDDAEGESLGIASSERVARVTSQYISAGIAALTGDIQQVPSSVSAIKVDGQRAYARVRAGEDVQLDPRPVTVHAFELCAERRVESWIDLDVDVTCSSGTYIRALARDLGVALMLGGHLTALRRTRVGPFDVAHAVSLDSLDVSAMLAPAKAAAQFFDMLHLSADEERDVGHGKRIAVASDLRGTLAAVSASGRLVALVDARKGSARVVTGFPPDDAERATAASCDAGANSSSDVDASAAAKGHDT